MKTHILTLICLTWFGLFATAAETEWTTRVEHNLTTNILPFWTAHSQDPRGGFYGEISREGVGNESADKGAILNARILWSFASAYRLYGISEYRDMADRAQAYYLQHFIDKQYGGVYWSVTPDGGISSDIKQTYALAYAIYGLSEHFRATGTMESLDAAISIYRTLEEHVHDHTNGGYREVHSRSFGPIEAKGVDGRTEPTKTMNTHIHVLEAYTNLYRVWPRQELKQNILELIDILGHHLYNPNTGHLILFCDNEWQVLEQVDSYGHDIETAWLLTEAAEVLGDKVLLQRIQKQAVQMTDAALREGMTTSGAMIYEKNERGYRRDLQWWVQCEVVIGCINAWQITGKQAYLEQAQKTWKYIEQHYVDTVYGEWYRNLQEDGTPILDQAKANVWFCPYHNSRMAYEVARRMAHQGVHTEVMAWSNLTGVRMEGELIDFESSLRVGRTDGYMEASGRERQSGVRYRREGLTQIVDIPLHGAHFHQEVTDIDDHHVSLSWTATADTTLQEGAYFCISLPAEHYASAKIYLSSRKISVRSAERHLTLTLNRSVKAFVREERGEQVVYLTLLPTLKKGQQAKLQAMLEVDGTQHHEPVSIVLDMTQPGARFAGFGGNFRIQNPAKDPQVIDYCLNHMRVAMGRVELPWAAWDKSGKEHPHVQASAQMAARLKQIGMPVVVSCWFPPEWALIPGQKKARPGVAALRLDPNRKADIYASLASYLVYLKDEWGVEADYFSFNESDIGIDVLFSPEEHCTFIKEFGAVLADLHLPCRMLLGDNSDATTLDFIIPTLQDKDAHRYVGAVSFHSWRGCDDQTLRRWREAARSINVPLLVGEGSTDAAAHRYSGIFRESTFALYEINLYTRLCAICQPISILQWQLTADYSLLQGNGILGDNGPLRPTQRYYNLWQLSLTPADALAIPATSDKPQVQVAAFAYLPRHQAAVHIVNNAGNCPAHISGLPIADGQATVYITRADMHAEAMCVEVINGQVDIYMPAESFVSIIIP